MQSARGRVNLVRIDTLMNPGEPVTPWDAEGFDELTERILRARRNGRPVICSIGAHVIKCGLSRYLIALTRAGSSRIWQATAPALSMILSSPG